MLQLSKAIALATCLWVVAPMQAAPVGTHREPTSYCAYDLGPNLIVESINNRNQIAGTAILGDLTQAFVWDWEQGVRLLGVLPGAAISAGNDINDLGQLVGYSGGGALLQQAIVWDQQNGLRAIATLGGESSNALRINSVGDIMGVAFTASGAGEHMFFRSQAGDVVDLGDGIPFDMNDAGQVGFSRQAQQGPLDSDVFIWDLQAGEQQLGGFPEPRLILPSALNNRLHIVGSQGVDGFSHAIRWTPRKGMEVLTPLDEPTLFSHAVDVNEWGTVVGYMDQGFPIRPFIWRNRKTGKRDLTTLIDPTSPTVPQSVTLEPRSLNDLGWIAIFGHDREGTNPRSYVLAPKYRHDDTPCAAPPEARR
jgi:hypothetical protein